MSEEIINNIIKSGYFLQFLLIHLFFRHCKMTIARRLLNSKVNILSSYYVSPTPLLTLIFQVSREEFLSAITSAVRYMYRF